MKSLELLATANAAYLKHDLVAAEAAYRQALRLQPDLLEALYNLGVLLRDDQRLAEAKQLFQRVVAQKPAAAMAHNNLGIIAGIEGDFVATESHYRRAIELQPTFALAHFNLGQLLLKLGRFEEGWSECEWRWQTPNFTPIRGNLPRWDGSPLRGTLLVHTEQGAGDTFQFARFLPLIREKCERVVFVCPQPLLNMFQQGDWADAVRTAGEFDIGEFSCYLPLLERAARVATRLRTRDPCSGSLPYARAANRRTRSYSCAAGKTQSRTRVGRQPNSPERCLSVFSGRTAAAFVGRGRCGFLQLTKGASGRPAEAAGWRYVGPT